VSRFLLLLTAVAASFAALGTAKGAITITAGYNNVFALHGSGAFFEENSDTFDSLPETGLLAATAGLWHAKTSYDLREQGGQTTLDWEFVHTRAGYSFSVAKSYGYIHFIPDEDTSYSISGLYNVTGGPPSRQVVTLLDLTTGHDDLLDRYHLHSLNRSIVTQDQSLVVGTPTGDVSNVFGSTTGTLTAGHTYELYYSYEVDAPLAGDLGAIAVGNLNLTLAEPAAVPEPASLAIWTLGALGCAIGTYRRRKRTA
jgi:hypothetical protein